MCSIVGRKGDKPIVSQKIGERMKRARKEIGYSQEKLAERVDCTVATISSYEVGRTVPDIDMIMAIASELNVTVYWLLGIEDGMNSVLYAVVTILKLYSKEQQRAILNIIFILDKLFVK